VLRRRITEVSAVSAEVFEVLALGIVKCVDGVFRAFYRELDAIKSLRLTTPAPFAIQQLAS
jgi:hypothetical protein